MARMFAASKVHSIAQLNLLLYIVVDSLNQLHIMLPCSGLLLFKFLAPRHL